MKTAYNYGRFSTRKQGEQDRDSYRRQIKAAKEWCEKNGYILSDESFFDKGKSGYKGEHLGPEGELRRFLNLVEDGTIKRGSVLIIEEFSRLSRLKPFDSSVLFHDMIKKGIGLVFVMSWDKRVITEELINKEGNILQGIINECIRAHAESDYKSKRVSEAKRSKNLAIQNGAIVKHNCVPRYFTWNEQKHRYEPNEKIKHIKRLVSEYLDGKSLYEIATTYNRERIPSIKTGGKWSPRTVKYILQSRCLLGEYLGNPKFFDRIVDQDTFNKLQLLIDQQKGNRGRTTKLVNIFRGTARCVCGEPMNICTQAIDYRTKKKWEKAYRYLRCSSGSTGRPCGNNKCVPLSPMEVEFFLECLMSDPRRLFSSPNDQQIKTCRENILKHQTAVKDLTVKINKLIDLEQSLSMPELKTKLGTLDKQRETEQAALERSKMELARLETTPDQFNEIKDIVKEYQRVLSPAHTDLDETYKAADQYGETIKHVQAILADNAVRSKLRLILPTIIKKVVVDSNKRTFEVVNQYGKSVYCSDGEFECL